MQFHIITLFPEMLAETLKTSILGRAQKENKIAVSYYNIRDFGKGKYKQVDDLPYGGGAGMVLMPDPLAQAIEQAKQQAPARTPVIYLSAQGKRLRQTAVERFSKKKALILICGHYEGLDQRIIDLFVDEEISIGDFVLTGGELPALVVIDAVSRLLPGVLGSDASHQEESFSKALERKKEYPHYTRPEVFRGLTVPKVLLSGHHAEIAKWRKEHCR